MAAAVIAAVPLSAAAGAETRISPLTRSSFAPYVNSTFRLANGWQGLDVVLTRIDDLASTTPTTREDRFSLIFHSRESRVLPQETRRLSHPHRRSAELFVVPVGPPGHVQTYQAVVHRA